MLAVEGLAVSLGGDKVLRDVSVQVTDGELVGLLGPSGSGKTTLLRAISGLVGIESGDIRWDGDSVADVPTHLREFGLMFQGYALFPHLDVAGNVGFGLRMRGDFSGDAVAEALEWVGLAGFGSRQVDSLSGGEQQRVALARTLAPRPRLVMLDEPLGALDRNLRARLMNEIRSILKEREVTGIIVTHDREEATTMSDRLALMRSGSIVQTGSLEHLLANPVDDWVTQFLT